jgi:pimeloyl-ACP methyl ester carboxylesterase
MKRFWFILAAIVVVLSTSVIALRAGVGNSDRDAITARWATPPSRFITVDGVPIHVREEGAGPVVVLLHGSIVDLSEWDEVTVRLKEKYKVIRFDWPPYGLSGPDPTGVYSTPRAAELMDGLMRNLGHDRFALVATSNGSNVALEYNRLFPGHATAMAFSMLPLERPSQTRKVDWRIKALLWFHKNLVPNWRHQAFWQLVLKDTTPPTYTPEPHIAERIRDMNNLPGALERQASYIAANTKLFKTTDVGAVAETVRVPVLLQWCSFDDVISQGASASLKRFTNTKVQLIEYKSLGHFPMWENPDLFTHDLGAFLDQQIH